MNEQDSSDRETKILAHKVKKLTHDAKKLDQEMIDAEVQRTVERFGQKKAALKREHKTQRFMTKILNRAGRPRPRKPKPERRLKNKRVLLISAAGVPVEDIEDEFIALD